MTIEELKNYLESESAYMMAGETALNIVLETLTDNYYDWDDVSKIDIAKLTEQCLKNEKILHYEEELDYLKEPQATLNFEDAICCGYKTLTDIVEYYLWKEIDIVINKIIYAISENQGE